MVIFHSGRIYKNIVVPNFTCKEKEDAELFNLIPKASYEFSEDWFDLNHPQNLDVSVFIRVGEYPNKMGAKIIFYKTIYAPTDNCYFSPNVVISERTLKLLNLQEGLNIFKNDNYQIINYYPEKTLLFFEDNTKYYSIIKIEENL